MGNYANQLHRKEYPSLKALLNCRRTDGNCWIKILRIILNLAEYLCPVNNYKNPISDATIIRNC